ncbi:MAG: glucose-6-phosphate dehydrogenase [Candidatus Peribacteraceae bacterium]
MLKASEPCSLILFGASGHLARIKIYPALYVLALKKRLPDHFALIGFARTPMSDQEFRSIIERAIRDDMPEVNDTTLSTFLSHCHYHTGQYDDQQSFVALSKKLDTLEGERRTKTVRLAYLSIPPSAFESTLHNLCAGNVHEQGLPFRAIIEKPVGSDLRSFEALEKTLLRCFRSDEIYILDHYLGKEAVRNAYYLRHANPVIERLMKNTLISNVQITALETAGLEGRAGYFDAVGTLRDMVQSHLLEIAALLTMRLVGDASDIRAARLDAMQKFFLPHSSHLSDIVLQGQYAKGSINGKDVPGYTEEKDVDPASRTATFIAMRLQTRAPHFDGVPFFLRSGKRLKEKRTRIAIEFHDSPPLVGKNEAKNRLEIILQGEAGMKLTLMTKLGGSDPKFRPLILEDPLVCIGDCLAEHGLLLLEAINGNQTWFLSPDEVRASWRLIDPVQAYLDEPATELHQYEAGSAGIAPANAFIEQFGHSWHA